MGWVEGEGAETWVGSLICVQVWLHTAVLSSVCKPRHRQGLWQEGGFMIAVHFQAISPSVAHCCWC